MATLTKIKYSQLENRFDSEYYRPEYLNVEKKLKDKKNVFTIAKIKESIQHPHEFKREYAKTGGIPFLRVSNIKNGYIDNSDVEFVYPDSGVAGNKICEGDILITRSGTVGVPAIVTKEFNDSLISADFLLLKLKPRINNLVINPYYVYVFLSSKFGFYQSQRNLIGAVQKHINTEGLGSIRIPVPPPSFQEHIEKLVKETHEKRKLADQRYKEAEQLLYKELGIEKLELAREKTFETTFSEVEKTMRFDPESYKPEYIECEGVLKNINSVPLSSVASPSKARFDPNNAPTQYFSYIDISNVDIRTGEVELQKIRCYEAPTRARKKVELDDVIISTVRPNRNAVAIINEILDGCVCSTGFSVIKPEKINPYCLFLFLKTEYAINQLVKKTTASMYPAVSEGDLFNLQVPIPSEIVQKDIEKMIRESFNIRKEAKSLLDQAKTEVEELIEKGR